MLLADRQIAQRDHFCNFFVLMTTSTIHDSKFVATQLQNLLIMYKLVRCDIGEDPGKRIVSIAKPTL